MTEFIEPVVGMGCTVSIGIVSYAATIIKVETTRQPGYDITVQNDISTPAEGHDYYGTQKYTYAPNLKGSMHVFRFEQKKANNGWHEIWYRKATRRWLRTYNGHRLDLDVRETYSNPSS